MHKVFACGVRAGPRALLQAGSRRGARRRCSRGCPTALHTRPRAQVLLWPIGLILLCLPFALLTGFNPTRFVLSIYFG